jgi:transposase
MEELRTMSTKEMDRAAVMARLVERTLSQRAAAEILQMTVRQVRRLQRADESQGAFALASKRRGKPSNRRLAAEVRERVVGVVKERYADFGPILACEKLREQHEVSALRVREPHPARVGPAPHGAVADALRRVRVEHGDARGVGAEQPGAAGLPGDERGDGHDHVDVDRHGAPERLRSELDSVARPASTLALDQHVLEVLFARGLDDERVGELAILNAPNTSSRKAGASARMPT